MANPQLHLLELNAKTGEVFLRLRKFPNIILTPPRWEDEPLLIPYLNDPRVCDWLSGPPYPYTLQDSKDFLARIKPPADEVIQHLKDADPAAAPIIVGECPVWSIREVRGSEEVFLGGISIIRCENGELMGPNGVDWENKKKREEENNALAVGDPSIIWTIGDWLAPSHHGRGIMTDVIRTLLNDWAVPRMGVRHVWATAFTGNEGSVKVFLKNGFKLVTTHENHVVVKGKMRGLHLLEWQYEG
ncbi:unnamed protein product [Cyclocybe aegerita]|uniref:N-acetyltransferase domain-containing protein n=1 Tax=Cyclocybe aegerita TaxID=1973307 RepID=A0A8S0W2Y0_CYCAE|nr:unnamed protein product [Cyclocybe aegerita]